MRRKQLPTEPDDLLESADVGKILDITPSAVRQLAQRGRLQPARVTPRGTRLFRRSDVERFAAERATA